MNSKLLLKTWLLFAILMPCLLRAAVLPEDRSDLLYHRYDGGGMVIDGPSLLVRKSFLDKFSASANYYIDNVSAASIDVLANASPYIERRKEYSVGLDYLNNKTTLSTSFTNSSENDYEANTAFIGVSQDFFGDLSTLSFGYSKGWDTVMKRGDADFKEFIDRHNFKIDWTQVITKNWIASIGVNTVTDQGYLNNPYRVVRYLDPNSGIGFRYQTEVYPETRTSTAVAFRSMYYLPYRAAFKFEMRGFNDTWDINAKNFEVAYIHPYQDEWIFEAKIRQYTQTEADFYRDLIDPSDNAQNTEFVARDKEMSAFSNISYGLGVSYEKELHEGGFFKKFAINLNIDYFQFEFDNFRDVLVHDTQPGQYAVGQEPLYAFDATVTRFFFSIWY
ncbi:DUF3570 domain-containing protein [Pleionea litopenaei]|uniref:DUF3570 domain-containing protein n=1 Tax=Pleionea litopenaei TaxID=3070815 RepID=A0AA51RVN6_9GAMM|nr:DUF3570 domain-containing protein [Pleionea sp. HL-JVS1]WMS88503.1 DUF3570 domain-containing protein [Pleionea sp. HL-JVS1]